MKTFIIAVAALMILGGNVSPSQTQGSSDTDLLVLHLPRTLDTTYLSISYYLTGSFGGYGGFVRTKPDTWDYAIETSYENQPAETVKAIIFCPGYEMKLLDVPSLRESSVRDATIELKSLPTIRLSGKVVLPETDRAAGLRIEATYLAYLGHEFFGILDGMVRTFTVASTSVSEDGFFFLMVPDFAHDSSPSVLSLGSHREPDGYLDERQGTGIDGGLARCQSAARTSGMEVQ